MTSPRFVRRWREGRRTRRRRRGRHSNYMEQAPGEGRVEVGKQKEFPAGKSSRFIVSSTGSPEGFTGGDEEARREGATNPL